MLNSSVRQISNRTVSQRKRKKEKYMDKTIFVGISYDENGDQEIVKTTGSGQKVDKWLEDWKKAQEADGYEVEVDYDSLTAEVPERFQKFEVIKTISE